MSPLFLSATQGIQHNVCAHTATIQRINIVVTAIYLCGNDMRLPTTSMCGRRPHAVRMTQFSHPSRHIAILLFPFEEFAARLQSLSRSLSPSLTLSSRTQTPKWEELYKLRFFDRWNECQSTVANQNTIFLFLCAFKVQAVVNFICFTFILYVRFSHEPSAWHCGLFVILNAPANVIK